jgi:hypothetical protein
MNGGLFVTPGYGNHDPWVGDEPPPATDFCVLLWLGPGGAPDTPTPQQTGGGEA